MRRSDSGKGYPKALFALAVLVAACFAASKIIPVFVHNYELNDYIHSLSTRMAGAGQSITNAEPVIKDVVDKANDLELPVTRENVKVTVSMSKVTIEVDYEVPVDLKVYTWVVHFTPSAESPKL